MIEVDELVLPNGFRALLLERHSLPVVASVIWYQVGSRDERHGETGVSHFLEHMMFKGTDRYRKGEIDLITSKLGGSNNAFTDNDATAYYFSLAADRWQQALEIEANRMTQCRLDPAEFAAEKKVVLEELAMGEDDPWRVLHQALEAQIFQVHPYHHPVIGWREDLERLEVGGMRGYYERHYGPNRAFAVVVGDFDRARTRAAIAELFGGLPARAAARGQVLAEPAQRGERRSIVHFPGNVVRLALAVRTCTLGEPDDFVLDVVSILLGGGRTSRLYRRLVLEEELATGVSVANEVRREPGVFWMTAELVEGKDPERAERVLREEVLRLRDDGPTAAELKRARAQLRAGFLFDQETTLDAALRIGRFEALGKGWRLLREVLPAYDRVGRKEVRAAVERWFADDAWNVAWSLPDGWQRRRQGRR
jgi:zinc protease